VTVPVWEKDGVEVGMPAGVAVGRVVDVPAKGGKLTTLILTKDANNDQSKDNDTVSTNVDDDAERRAHVSNNQDMDKIAKLYWLHHPDFPYSLPTTASTNATVNDPSSFSYRPWCFGFGSRNDINSNNDNTTSSKIIHRSLLLLPTLLTIFPKLLLPRRTATIN
jgi:hypothetical protein